MKASAIEERAFFYKMVGDYYRYASEATQSEGGASRLPKYKKGALDGYKKASEVCTGLKPYNTVSLGLALNFSVFQYEVMKDPLKACEVASEALK